MMSLTNYERETIINYNEAEKTASIYTCSQSLKTRLAKLSLTSPEEIKLEKQDKYSVTYSVPKTWIRIQKPPKGIPRTEEQKEMARQLMKKLHENRKAEE